MPKMRPPIKRITIEITTLEAVLKGDGSPTGCSMVLDLLRQALDNDPSLIVVEDERTRCRYRLTKAGLVELPGAGA